MIGISDLLSEVTAKETYERYLSNLERLGVPARSWRIGGSLRTILQVIATNYAELSAVVVALSRAGFLETAEKSWLTLLARSVFGEQRQGATQATGLLRLTNSGGGLYSWQPGQLIALHSINGKSYLNTTQVDLMPGQTRDAPIASREFGSGSNAGPGEIVDLETKMLGVSVSNPAAVVGVDEETDPMLRARCRDKLGTLSNGGPRRAFSYAAKTAKKSDGRPTDVNRVFVSRSSSTGEVHVLVASKSGAVSAEDLIAVRASVEALARPDCVTVFVASAAIANIGRDVVVWLQGTQIDVVAVEVALRVAAQAWVSAYPIGGFTKPPATQGWWFAAGLAGTLKAAHASVYDVDGTGADVALNGGEVPSLKLGVTLRVVSEVT